jgi:NAD(P)-dependent dehydrogenase (short-subunit alcohol dehydrogenase family)
MSRLMVFGGTSGIGAATVNWANLKMPEGTWEHVLQLGREDYDIRNYPRVHESVRQFRPTHVVYSAGVNVLDWICDVDPQTWRDIMDVNVYGFMHVMQAMDDLYPGNRRTSPWPNQPSVVAVTSDAAWRPMRGSAAYCCSKAALEMLVKVTAREYAPLGWRINAVAPGKVSHTNMTKYVNARVPELRGWSQDKATAYEAASTPLGRPATPEEVAQVIMDVLTGPESLNGAVVPVNGAREIR